MPNSERLGKMPVVHSSSHRPIPPLKELTEYIEAGAVTFGVEFRLLTNEIYTANFNEVLIDEETGKPPVINDRGVSIHVFATGTEKEHLRFDCFEDDPHYHYILWEAEAQRTRRLDTVADGDPLAWSLDRIGSRLAHMLTEAEVSDLANRVDQSLIDEALPRIAEAAYRARFQSPDAETVRQAAVKV